MENYQIELCKRIADQCKCRLKVNAAVANMCYIIEPTMSIAFGSLKSVKAQIYFEDEMINISFSSDVPVDLTTESYHLGDPDLINKAVSIITAAKPFTKMMYDFG